MGKMKRSQVNFSFSQVALVHISDTHRIQ